MVLHYPVGVLTGVHSKPFELVACYAPIAESLRQLLLDYKEYRCNPWLGVLLLLPFCQHIGWHMLVVMPLKANTLVPRLPWVTVWTAAAAANPGSPSAPFARAFPRR